MRKRKQTQTNLRKLKNTWTELIFMPSDISKQYRKLKTTQENSSKLTTQENSRELEREKHRNDSKKIENSRKPALGDPKLSEFTDAH